MAIGIAITLANDLKIKVINKIQRYEAISHNNSSTDSSTLRGNACPGFSGVWVGQIRIESLTVILSGLCKSFATFARNISIYHFAKKYLELEYRKQETENRSRDAKQPYNFTTFPL